MRHLRRRTPHRDSRVAPVCLASLAIFIGGCKHADEGDAAVQAVVAAQVEIVRPQAFTQTMSAIGQVVPRAGHVERLSAPAAGRVSQVFVTTGQSVVPGQTLIELDQTPFRVASEAADAALATAERAAERKVRLANEGIIPHADAEQAQAEVAKARADASSAQRAEGLSVLKAQIAGVVTSMSATLGASVDPAQVLVEISDPRALDVLLSVTPTEAARVQPGMKVVLSAGQSAAGEQLGIGTVADVSGIVDTATRSVAVRVQPPTTRRPLRIGETLFGTIDVATVPNAIVVPADAVVPEGEGFKVFVVDDKGLAHGRAVTIGGRASGVDWIASGLKAGERIVTYGAYGMQDSAKVAPLTPAARAADSAHIDSARGDSSRGTKPPAP
jgi:RND family efflux transporter MFP subunit